MDWVERAWAKAVKSAARDIADERVCTKCGMAALETRTQRHVGICGPCHDEMNARQYSLERMYRRGGHWRDFSELVTHHGVTGATGSATRLGTVDQQILDWVDAEDVPFHLSYPLLQERIDLEARLDMVMPDGPRRKAILNDDDRQDIVIAHKAGISTRDIASMYCCAEDTIKKLVARQLN